jgi:hypothetical protein
MVLRLGDEDHSGSGAHPCNRVLLSALDTGAVRARDLQLPSRNKSRCQWLEYLSDRQPIQEDFRQRSRDIIAVCDDIDPYKQGCNGGQLQ